MQINPDGITRYHESSDPLLSVLICTLPRRAEMLAVLLAKFDAQKHPAVEVLVASDDGTLSIGSKRQLLLDDARGRYVAFCDDDDGVTDDYCSTLAEAARTGADVLTFKQLATFNGAASFEVVARLSNPYNQQVYGNGNGQTIQRRPWHWCAWRRDLAMLEKYRDISYGEDWDWCERVLRHCKSEHFIDRVLHLYVYNHKTSVSDERRDTGTVKKRVLGMDADAPLLPNIIVENVGKTAAALPITPAPFTRFLMKYPTRGRHELFQRTIKAWINRATEKHELHWIVSVDDDDPSARSVIEFCRNVGIECFSALRASKIAACNRDMPPAYTFDIVVLISDDMVPDCDGWDEAIASDMTRLFPDYDGALWFPDGRQNRINCFEVQGSRWYERHGFLYHPDYISEFSDNESTDVGLREGKLARVERRLVRHEWIGHTPDQLFHENCQRRGQDQITYERRKAAGFP